MKKIEKLKYIFGKANKSIHPDIQMLTRDNIFNMIAGGDTTNSYLEQEILDHFTGTTRIR